MKDLNQKISEIILPFQNSIAIKAKDREDFTYLSMRKLIIKNSNKLKNFSKKRNKIFAYVVSPGPDAITIFLTLLENFAAAPLNPNYTKQEFISYLKDLNCDAVIIEKDKFKNAIEAANEIKLPIIFFKTLKKAGDYKLLNLSEKIENFEKKILIKNKERLILHTSGTTSKPKTVSLSQENILSSALNIIDTLELNSNDKCLNIMPLFHIHGLIGCVLSTILSGGTIISTKGFNVLNFFSYIEIFKPSWFSAVPSMYKVIVKRKKIIFNDKRKIRFVRSSSAPITKELIKEIEIFFNCPLIEAYGMTEASHQITSNKFCKNQYKRYSLGKPQGVELSILSDNNKINFFNSKGEILIKGKNVIKSYKNNEKANQDSFFNSWFKTGDEGFIDKNGFLQISGRIKEIINRGGEKISPYEIDEILLKNKEIEEAVTFPVFDKRYGEVVNCAIVLKENSFLNEKKIIEFLRNKLSSFKIPSKIYIIKEIPKSPTGKIKRLEMASLLGLK